MLQNLEETGIISSKSYIGGNVMRREIITSARYRDGSGEEHRLEYAILAEPLRTEMGESETCFGVAVREDSGAWAAGRLLSCDYASVHALVLALARGSVTPVTLLDVVYDWIER